MFLLSASWLAFRMVSAYGFISLRHSKQMSLRDMVAGAASSGSFRPIGQTKIKPNIWKTYTYTHTHTHTKCVNTGKRGPPIVPLLFILEHFRNTSHMFCTRLANGGLFPTGDPIVPFVISPRFECLNKRTHTHTHTQTCKHRQTGSSHCSSFVYTLTFSQHLSYVLYMFGKRGPFSNWGPYCSFCYKSPV